MGKKKTKKKSSGDAEKKCHLCGATSSTQWDKCVVCGEVLCDECAIECDTCHNFYCMAKCGTDFIDEEEYKYCFNCKGGKG